MSSRSPTDTAVSPSPNPTSRIEHLPAITAVVWVNLLLVVAYSGAFGRVVASERMENWATVFLSLMLQAMPFLVLGVVVSAAVSTLVPTAWFERALPKSPVLAVPAAGAFGALLPGCECSAVPVAGRLMQRGVPQAAALTFLLASPAINPVVVVATSVAFPNQPMMVLARFLASFVAAVTVGLLWQRFASPEILSARITRLVEHHRHDDNTPKVRAFANVAIADFTQAGGYLVLGAMLVATFQALIPSTTLDRFGGDGIVPILTLAALAVVLSICSEADAFVAASLSRFSLTARLVFLTVGPMVDLKLVALQSGTFGRRFTQRFAPLTFLVCVASGVAVGQILLGGT